MINIYFKPYEGKLDVVIKMYIWLSRQNGFMCIFYINLSIEAWKMYLN